MPALRSISTCASEAESVRLTWGSSTSRIGKI